MKKLVLLLATTFLLNGTAIYAQCDVTLKVAVTDAICAANGQMVVTVEGPDASFIDVATAQYKIESVVPGGYSTPFAVWPNATYSQAPPGEYILTMDAYCYKNVYPQEVLISNPSVVVEHIASPTPPAAASVQTFCSGATISNIEVRGYSNLVWYDAPTGGNILPETTPLVDGAIYYLARKIGSCESETRTAVKAVIDNNIVLPAPKLLNPQSLCGSVTLADILTDGSNNMIWYDAAVFGNQLPLTTPLSDGSSYYAALSAGGSCQSVTPTQVFVTIANDIPDKPTVTSPQSFCPGATLTDIAVPNNQILWYETATGGSPLDITTTLTDGTTYYAAQKAGDCESTERAPVKVLFDDPAGPEAPSPQAFCGTGYTLADLEVNGSGIVWYDAPTGGNMLPSSTALTSIPTMYYAAQSAYQCESSRVRILAYTNQEPAAPSISGDLTVCSNVTTFDLTSVVQAEPGITYSYYSDNGITVITDPTQAPTPPVNTSYYVKATNSSSGCESQTLAAISVVINYPPVASVSPTSANTTVNSWVVLTVTDNNTNSSAGAKTAAIIDGNIAGIELVNGTLKVTGKAIGTTSIIYTSVNENGCTTTLTIPVEIANPTITVDNSLHDPDANRYILACGHDFTTVTITHSDPSIKVYYEGIEGRTFTVSLPTAGEHTVNYTVVDGQGNSHSYSLTLVKPFAFADVIQKRWDNTLTVINNPANNGGYTFTNYAWYYNGTRVGTGQSYSAGSDGRALPAGEYYVVLTANGLSGTISTCSETVTRSATRSNIVVYPNPVRRGNAVSIQSDLTREAGAVVELFNLSGTKVSSQPVSGGSATVTAPGNAGTYILRITAAGQAETFKLIVE